MADLKQSRTLRVIVNTDFAESEPRIFEISVGGNVLPEEVAQAVSEGMLAFQNAVLRFISRHEIAPATAVAALSTSTKTEPNEWR